MIDISLSTNGYLVIGIISELRKFLQYEIAQDVLEFDRGLMLMLYNIMISGCNISLILHLLNQDFGWGDIGTLVAGYQYYSQISTSFWEPKNLILVELFRELYLRIGL